LSSLSLAESVLMWEATLDAKGRIVLPKALRDALDLVAGKRVRPSVEGNRIVITTSISPGVSAAKMKGCVKEGSAVAETDPLELKRMWNHHLPEIRSKIPIRPSAKLGDLGEEMDRLGPFMRTGSTRDALEDVDRYGY
jgi:AbrB family looped-hinge helix DNA binding protein